MPSIDERVVAMAFENAKFEAGVAQTLRTLEKLNASLANVGKNNGLEGIEKSAEKVRLNAPMSALDKLRAKFSRGVDPKPLQDLENASQKVSFLGPMSAIDKLRQKLGGGFGDAAKGFNDIERASNHVTLEGAGRAIDSLSGKFSALQVAGVAALATIVSKITGQATQMAKALSVDQISGGLKEYETNLNSIQTILANTEASGAKLSDVNEALKQLNTYSDQTIYNFSQMADSIGLFTAAGVDLDQSVASIKGIANLAALSGSNNEKARTAMIQLSQAISAGKVGLQDWNSVVNAGMGGATFQRALATTAEQMGVLEKGAVSLVGPMKNVKIHGDSFRDSMNVMQGGEPWLTSDVLTKTLQQFTGDMTDAELASQGFTQAQIDAIQKTAKTAKAAATEVKTLSQVFDVAKETMGSGWSSTFQLIFGDFEEAKTTFTGLSNFFNGFINASSTARNKVLADWKDLGGRAKLIEGVKAAFDALMSVVRPIGDAFRDIFPRQTGKQLLELTVRFRDLMESLKLSGPAGDTLRRIFAGLFAVVHIGWTVIKETARAIFDLLGVVGHGSGGILNFVASISDFVVALDKAISQGGLLRGIFASIVGELSGVVSVFKAVGESITSVFTGADNATTVSDAVQNLTSSAGPLATVAEKVADAWDRVRDIFVKLGNFLAPVVATVKSEAQRLGDAIGEAFKTENFDKVMSVLQTGFLGGILLILKRFRSSLGITLEGGLFEKVNTILGTLTGNLKAMQQNLQAKTLFAIAASLGVLVAGIYVLSTIDGKKLTTAMTAMAVGMGQLVGAIGLLGKLMEGPGKAGILMMPVIAASLIGLAIAATILAAAVKIFSTMSWEELIKGLVGVGVALTAVGLATKLLGPGLLLQGPALIALAIAMNLLAAAVKQFAALSWEEIAKGIVGVAGSLVALAAGLAFMGPSLIVIGPGLIAAAIGMSLLAGAVSAFGSMDVDTLAKGIFGMAAAIVALGLAVSVIPPTVALQGAGLIVLAAGLTGLAAAIGILGSMKVGTLVKGIIAMGGALVVLGLGLTAMSGTLVGSVALLAAAAALVLLGPAIAFMGNLKWSTILSGLAAIAVTLGVLAIAGLLVVGPITALSFALGAFGIALALVTSPIYVLAKALQLLGATGTKGVAVMVTALTAFVALLPKIIIDFLKGLVDIIAGIAELAPKVVESIGVIIGQLLAVIVDAAPKVGTAVLALIVAFVKVLNDGAPKLFDAGFKLIGAFLSSLSANVGKLAEKAAEIIAKFLDSLKGQSPRLTQAGVVTLTSFLGGISKQFPKLVGTVVDMVARFVSAVAANIPKVIGAAVNLILKFIGGIYSMVPRIILAGVGIIGDFLTGIAKAVPKIISKAAEVAGKFITGVAKGLVRLVNIGADAVIDFLNGVANAIRTKGPELRQAGWNVADAILDGIVAGFKDLGNKAVDAVKGLIDKLPKAARKVLGIDSPSKVFQDIGKFTMLGLDKGIGDHGPQLSKTALGIGNSVIGAFKDVFQIQSPSKVLKEIGQQVGRGFADGLKGSGSDIRGAFRELNDKIKEELANERQAIRDGRKDLVDLHKQYADKLDEIAGMRKEKKPDNEAIKQAQEEARALEKAIASSEKSLGRHNATLERLIAAHDEVTVALKDEKAAMVRLSADYDNLTKQLEVAEQKLEEITQKRTDFFNQTRDQFSTLPDINKDAEDQVADYKTRLQAQIEATKKFYTTMMALRKAGLDDVTFKKLLSEGIGAQDFASELLAAGQSGIKQVNDLDQQLLDVSTSLGNDAADSLYLAGVQAAQGLVDGIKSRMAEYKKVMEDLAKFLVDAIKAQLGIKSPSRVFAEVGMFMGAGLVKGIQDAAGPVRDAAGQLGTDAVSAMQSTFADISKAVTDNIDVDPTITPVLDLSQVQKDAQKLGDMTNVIPITAAASYGQASAISAEQAAALAAAADTAVAPMNHVELTQNNYSPESLSDVEIYRQTNNQLSQLRSALGLTS